MEPQTQPRSTTPEPGGAPLRATCLHCSSPVPASAGAFCCPGCEAVHQLLVDEGLERYYDLGQGQVAPVTTLSPHGLSWLAPYVADVRGANGTAEVELAVQGLHCAACVWLLEELADRGQAQATVNPVRGTLRLACSAAFDLQAYVEAVERFGYRLGPPRTQGELGAASSGLALRLGIVAGLTLQVMLFSISFYSGLGPDESAVYPLFSALMFLLSTAVVLIGGSLFFRSAWQSLRQGVLHLDLPIAVGIALAYGASVWQAAVHRGQHSYLDTLDVFVTLMLLGRLLEERVLVRNRQLLLEDDGIEGLLVERRAPARPGQTESVPASELCQRDLLLLSPGDLLPVDGICRSPRGAVSCEWITGEPEVRSVAEGEPVAAGSCNRGQAPMWVEAVTGFAASPLPGLLGSATDRDRDRPRHTPSHVRFADRLARGWVVTVLALSALAFALWWGRDPQKAVDVTVALLVVTCPCAIGIAAPLGREAVRARLRRAGLFVRRRDLIERLARVRTILFDKTGTLTLGRLELDDVAPLAALSRTDRDALYTLTAGSSHPRSRSLHRALAALGAQLSLLPVGDLAEEPGLGIGARVGGHTYRVGSPAWALGYSVNGAETALVRDGVPLGFVSHRETLRPDARALLGLLAQRGYRVGLLSGDQPARVHAVAAALGLPAEAAEGGLRPEDKAARVTALDHDDTLYLGDGINDTPAFARAWVAGTPAIERPSVPARADFFLVGEGLSSIALALELCRRLDSILRHNLLLSVTYNTLVVAACLLGWMTPLRAAVAMPTSSLALIALSLVRLERVGGGSSACAPLPSCSTVAAPPLSVRTA